MFHRWGSVVQDLARYRHEALLEEARQERERRAAGKSEERPERRGTSPSTLHTLLQSAREGLARLRLRSPVL